MAGIIIDMPFSLENSSPVDTKQNFKTIAEMKAFDVRFLSDTAMATNDEDGNLYIYNVKNLVDTTTGKWRVVQGGGSVVDVVEKDNKNGVSSKGVYKELYTTVPKVPMYYKLADKQDGTEGLIIVANGTISNPDTEVEESTVNANKADGDLTVYTVGQYMLKIEEVPEHDLTIYIPRDEVYTKTEIDAKLDEANPSTTEQIKVYGVCKDLGYKDGDIIPEGTSFTEVLKTLLQKVIHPTYIEPTMTLVSNVKLVEKGVATNVTLTPTFTKNDAGAINGYKVYRDGAIIENQTATSASAYTDSGNIFNASTVYKYEIAYDAGADKTNNVGELDPVGKIEAGSIFKTVTIKPVNPTYIGIVANGTAIDESVATGLTKLITEANVYDYKATANFEDMVLVSERPLKSVINQNNYSILDSFTTQSLVIGSITYNVYILPNINVTNFNYKFNF